ncbi:MAG: hypothetical protein R2838_18475 [Caldilineaceae bacterium]
MTHNPFDASSRPMASSFSTALWPPNWSGAGADIADPLWSARCCWKRRS